jgi:alpha-glucosidase (family GH31 glycosyl hydrolase)
VDYWDGKVYSGKQWLNGYTAPLDKLPLFVKAGSVIPMNPLMNFDGERPLDTLFLDIYPGKGPVQYRLYEDDGNSREFKKGVNATTLIGLKGKETIQINAIKGNYKGMLQQRNYTLYIHLGEKPESVWVNGVKNSHWEYTLAKQGVLTVQCGRWQVNKKVVVQLK